MMVFFKKLPSSLRKARAKGYQFAPLWVIFDVKVDLRRKSRLVIGGHIVNLSRHEIYASTMKSVSSRIMMKIVDANNMDVMKGEIGNAYFNTNTEENIYTGAGADFEFVVIMDEGGYWE